MKKLVLITLSALLLIGLSANLCQAQTKKELRATLTKTKADNTKLNKKVDSLKKENKELLAKITSGNEKTAITISLNKEVDSLKAALMKVQDEKQQLQSRVTDLIDKNDILTKEIEGLMKEYQELGGEVAIQPESKVLDTMTKVLYDLKDTAWAQNTAGETVKMPKKGEIGFSEDKSSAYVRESDFQTGDFDKQIAVLKSAGHQIKRVRQ